MRLFRCKRCTFPLLKETGLCANSFCATSSAEEADDRDFPHDEGVLVFPIKTDGDSSGDENNSSDVSSACHSPVRKMERVGETCVGKINPRCGFCVICERGFSSIRSHMNTMHKNVFSPTVSNLYVIACFRGRQVMVPRGIFLERELARCDTCLGVFYKHRLRNHECGNPEGLIEEGNGLRFCLLCQFRCDDLESHWDTVHGRNDIYEIRDVHNTRTLLPKHIWEKVDLQYFQPCSCGGCLQLKYANRIKRACGKD